MFDVIAYVYENYFTGEAGPEPDHLECKLNSVGFDPDELSQAMTWLRGLHATAQGLSDAFGAPPTRHLDTRLRQPSAQSVRVYPSFERRHLGDKCLGFIAFLEASGALPAHLREMVLERAMSTPGAPLALEDLKLTVLMVYWSVGYVPSALILDELCQGCVEHVLH